MMLSESDKYNKKLFIAEFIETYRGLPALWDVKSKVYNDRAKKRQQYDVLIEKYRERYPDAGKADVVRKINTLRTGYRRELKRVHDAIKSGADAEDVDSSLWYFELMGFLQERPTASISTMDLSQCSVEDNEDLDGDENDTSSTTNDQSLQISRKRKQSIDPTEEMVKLVSARLQQPQEDSDKIAAAWAVELRNMDPQQQLFAKKAINDILFEGQMGTLHRNSVEINRFKVIPS